MTEIQPVVDYLASYRALAEDDIGRIRAVVGSQIERTGHFHVTLERGMFVAS